MSGKFSEETAILCWRTFVLAAEHSLLGLRKSQTKTQPTSLPLCVHGTQCQGHNSDLIQGKRTAQVCTREGARMARQRALLACALVAAFVLATETCTVLELSGSGFSANVNHLLWAFPVFDHGINGTLYLDNTWFQYRCKKNGGLHDFLDLKHAHIVPWTAEKERRGKQARSAQLYKTVKCLCARVGAHSWHKVKQLKGLVGAGVHAAAVAGREEAAGRAGADIRRAGLHVHPEGEPPEERRACLWRAWP